jgi:membrane-anchored protein YejM (alkaline phosphatase superfamily)
VVAGCGGQVSQVSFSSLFILSVFLSWFLDMYFATYLVIVACCSQEMNGTTAILTSTICQPCLT